MFSFPSLENVIESTTRQAPVNSFSLFLPHQPGVQRSSPKSTFCEYQTSYILRNGPCLAYFKGKSTESCHPVGVWGWVLRTMFTFIITTNRVSSCPNRPLTLDHRLTKSGRPSPLPGQYGLIFTKNRQQRPTLTNSDRSGCLMHDSN